MGNSNTVSTSFGSVSGQKESKELIINEKDFKELADTFGGIIREYYNIHKYGFAHNFGSELKNDLVEFVSGLQSLDYKSNNKSDIKIDIESDIQSDIKSNNKSDIKINIESDIQPDNQSDIKLERNSNLGKLVFALLKRELPEPNLLNYLNNPLIDNKTKFDYDLFLLACKKGDLKLVQWLADVCYDISRYKIDKIVAKFMKTHSVLKLEKAFMLTCENGHISLAKWLLVKYPEINIRTENDHAFRWACINGHIDVSKWLLMLCPEMELRNYDITFKHCIKNKQGKIADWLLSKFPGFRQENEEDKEIEDYIYYYENRFDADLSHLIIKQCVDYESDN